MNQQSPGLPQLPPRPPPTIPELAEIPSLLIEHDQWVAWRYVPRHGTWTKAPINARTGESASSTDAATWSSIREALDACSRFRDIAGVGFVFTTDDPFAGIDLDDCMDEDGNVSPEARAIIQSLDSYAEVSPSGFGVKVFVIGDKPAGSKCRSKKVRGFGEIEIYDRDRFFTVTGRNLAGSPKTIKSSQEELNRLCDRFLTSQPHLRALDATGFQGSDDELIRAASAAKNGDKFRRLFAGDTSLNGDDDSAADQALCCLLAFWCGPDAARIDRIFRLSGLYRDKWERQDYRDRTIQSAIAGCREFYRTTSEGPKALGSATTPQIVIDTNEHRVADEVVKAIGADPELYQRGGHLVRVARDGNDSAGIVRAKGSATIGALPLPSLRERITKFCSLQKYDKKGELRSAHPPSWLVAATHARGDWPGIRTLTGLSDVPFVRPDGVIWQTPGYDTVTGVLFEPSADFLPIPVKPDIVAARAAVEYLLEAVCDFRFESDAHRSAWLAWLLTSFARFAYSGPSPLFLVDANVRGAGKGLLAQIIGEIVLGKPMPVSTYTHDVDEMRKRITSIAMAGDQLVLFDNLDGMFGNSALDAALTTTSWNDRLLGTNDIITLPLNPVWSATGNNVQVGADVARRIVYCRLDVLEERPEDRQDFRHPRLLTWIRENRRGLVTACVVIVAAYLQCGKPNQQLIGLGSFEGWSEVVRSAVVWTGQPDPCETRKQLAESSDTSRDDLEHVLDAWKLFDPFGNGVIISDMMRRVYGVGGENPQDPTSAVMRAALEEATGTVGKAPTVRQIGAWLRSNRRRVVNGEFLDHYPGKKRTKGAVWMLFRTASKPQ